jgi:DNA repair protein RecO (recombination protein O)
MLHKTEGIALSHVKYRDTSIIARIYTQRFGMQSYVVNGVRSAKSRTRMALFQPLSLLDLVVYYNKKKEIQRIAEIKFSEHLGSVQENIRKIAISLFITEFLGRALREDQENPEIFHFIKRSVLFLDQSTEHYESFHVEFLIKLSSFMGIMPQRAEDFLHDINSRWLQIPKKIALLQSVLTAGYGETPAMGHQSRNDLLDAVLQYYHVHLGLSLQWKSLQVLREVF